MRITFHSQQIPGKHSFSIWNHILPWLQMEPKSKQNLRNGFSVQARPNSTKATTIALCWTEWTSNSFIKIKAYNCTGKVARLQSGPSCLPRNAGHWHRPDHKTTERNHDQFRVGCRKTQAQGPAHKKQRSHGWNHSGTHSVLVSYGKLQI